jgi:uroporphyrinogen decarboxylase
MKSRHRVLLSLNHREPDRVPIFAPNVMETIAPYDPRVIEFLDSFQFDGITSLGGMIDHPSNRQRVSDTEFSDGYGCRHEWKGVGLPYCVYSPLAEAESIADVEAFDWPDPEAPDAIDPDAQQRAGALRAESGQAIGVGLAAHFHRHNFLRGFEQSLVDIKLNPGVFEAIATRIAHIHRVLLMRFLGLVGESVDLVIANDDLGTSVASYMSPDDFRRFVKPHYKRTMKEIKARYPHIKIYLHSHGQIMDLVPDLIDCGVDVLNPILPLDNMDPVVLKREYGSDLCFHAGIDIEHIVPFGTVAEIRDHVREVIEILAPGGGYWFKAQVISPVIPAENVLATYEAALEFGGY